MPWQRVKFKGQRVWAEVDESGELLVKQGRVPIRYSNKEGAKIYHGAKSRVEAVSGAVAEELPAGIGADSAPKSDKGGAKGSGFGSRKRTKAQAAMAQAAAEKEIASLSGKVILVFTDGACQGNPGPAGSGAVVVFPDGRRGEASRSLGHGTNNIGELAAIGVALDLLEEAGVKDTTQVVLFTDSSYSNGVLTKGWKPKANQALIAELRARLEAWPKLEIRWVAGHVGVEGNELADRLAVDGAAGISGVSWTP